MNTLNPIVQQYIGTLLRAVLLAAAGYLVNEGLITGDQAEAWSAAVAMALVGIGWSAWAKYRGRQKLMVALSEPRAMSENAADFIVQAGDVPSVLTPSSEVPKP